MHVTASAARETGARFQTVCVCVWERESESERDREIESDAGGGSAFPEACQLPRQRERVLY